MINIAGASDLCDLGHRILFRSGRWGNPRPQPCESVITLLTRRRDATHYNVIRNNEGTTRLENTARDAIRGAICGARRTPPVSSRVVAQLHEDRLIAEERSKYWWHRSMNWTGQFVPGPLNEPCPLGGAFCGAKVGAVYNKLHNPIRASDLCDLGLRILFRSGP